MTIKTRSRLALCAALAASVALFASAPAAAAAARAAGNSSGGGDLRLAVANPSRIFNEMKETRALKVKLEAEGQRLAGLGKDKEENLKKLQTQRNELRADHPDFEQANKDLMQALMEYEVWGKYTKLEAERNQKRQMRALFQKVEDAIAEVAERDQIDVVIADHRPELPNNLDQLSFDQLRALILQRNLAYTSERADISTAVILLLDSRYEGGGASGAVSGARNGNAGGAKTAAGKQPARRNGGQ